MIILTSPPEPEPMFAELVKAASENTFVKETFPKVYAAPPACIVVSVPAVNPKLAIEPPDTVILMIAPLDVP